MYVTQVQQGGQALLHLVGGLNAVIILHSAFKEIAL